MDIDSASPLSELEASIDHVFNDRNLLVEALTHRSYVNEKSGRFLADYERLEFFGDAVVSLYVSRMLLERFPEHGEGMLSRIRSALVDEASLAGVAAGLDLGRFLNLGRGEARSGGRAKKSILANAFEALLGALYLDGGEQAASRLVVRLFAPLIDRYRDGAAFRDYKTELQEVVQLRFACQPQYLLTDTSGPPHDRLFKVEVNVAGCCKGTGTGRSKKEAEQAAALEALAALGPVASNRS